MENLTLADNFTFPLLFGETFSEAVSVDLVQKNYNFFNILYFIYIRNRVRGNFMTSRIKGLYE